VPGSGERSDTGIHHSSRERREQHVQTAPRFYPDRASGGYSFGPAGAVDSLILALLTACIQQRDGVVVKSRGEGDRRFTVFARATDAVAGAAALQQALQTEPWPLPTPLRVRLALHTGEAELRGGDYYGAAVNRCRTERGNRGPSS